MMKINDADMPTNVSPIINEADFSASPYAGMLKDVENSLVTYLETMPPSSLQPFISRLRGELARRVMRRKPLEDEWLDACRRYAGQYDAATLARIHPNRCKFFIGLTRQKVHAAHAAISDYIMGTDDKCWSIIPGTLVDDLPFGAEAVDAIKGQIAKRVELLSQVIEGQLDECNFISSLDLATLEQCILGTGAMKGPFTVPDESSDWQLFLNIDQAIQRIYMGFDQVEKKGFRPHVQFVSIFNLYPDLEAANVKDGEGMFETSYITRAELINMSNQPGYSKIACLGLLKEQSKGNAVVPDWMIELRNIGKDGDPSETKRFEVVHYYGPVLGQELKECGCDIPDELLYQQVMSNIVYSGNYILKAKRWERSIPYHMTPYVRRPGFGPFGIGVPMLGKSAQDMYNAATRIMIDNAAIASGPILEVVADLLQPEEDPTNIYAWRVFLAKHDGTRRAINIQDLPAYTDQFLALLSTARQLMDEETFIPSLSQGEQGARTTDTATGMSILNSNAARIFKKAMRHIDQYLIEPLLKECVEWNYRYYPNTDLLARVQVKAKGSAAILAREIQSQRLMELTRMFGQHPMYKLLDAMRQTAKLIGIDPDTIMATEEEEREAIMRARGINPQPQGQPQQANQNLTQNPNQVLTPTGGQLSSPNVAPTAGSVA